jgi:hypothetical protein
MFKFIKRILRKKKYKDLDINKILNLENPIAELIDWCTRHESRLPKEYERLYFILGSDDDKQLYFDICLSKQWAKCRPYYNITNAVRAYQNIKK